MLTPQSQPAPKVGVMVLGVYHMANPGLDLVKSELDDHLSPKRQQEIADVLDQLAKYKPTKIVVEYPFGNDGVNGEYTRYLQGGYTLTANEIDQLGMRLAKKLGHQQLYPFDNQYPMDFDKVIGYAQQNGDSDFMQYLGQVQQTVKEKVMDPLAKHTVRENLLALNDPSLLKLGSSPYLRMARVGKGEEYPGADVVAGWYARNLRMYSNIWRFAKPGDRLLVIVGSGHAPILRQLIGDTEEMTLVEPSAYLK